MLRDGARHRLAGGLMPSWWSRNVERVMTVQRPSAEGSDAQIHGPDSGRTVGIAMVLSAVFIPMALAAQPGQFIVVSHHHRIGDGAVGAGRADIRRLRCALLTMLSKPFRRHKGDRRRRKSVFLAGLTACLIRARITTPIA